MVLRTLAYVFVGVASFQRGNAGTHPRAWEMRNLEEARGIKRKGHHVQALFTVRVGHKQPGLPETSLHPTFPPQPCLASASVQKVRGQKREAMCLFPCLHGAGKAVLGLGCGVCWDELPAAMALQVLLVILIRMTSSPEARFQHVPSTLPPVTLRGPPRSRTLVTSQSPQPPGPFVDLRWRICPICCLPRPPPHVRWPSRLCCPV